MQVRIPGNNGVGTMFQTHNVHFALAHRARELFSVNAFHVIYYIG